ncbi:MAG TPA: VOC family protein [Acidimicrobiales bacterium]
MGRRTKYSPGCFSWIDLLTTDIDAAADFYGQVLGWDGRDDGGYHLFSLPGGDVAGGFAVTGVEGIVARWNTYITVTDVDEMVHTAVGLGATVVQDPVDAHDAGRLAGLTDPGGAGFFLWQDGTRFGATYVNEPGAWSWSELMTRDPDGAAEFYRGLFGWDYERDGDGNDYRVILLDGRQIGGILTMPAEVPAASPPSWEAYFNVADLDATLRVVTSAGGIAPTDTREIPDVGRFATCRDPQGAPFILIQALDWET